MGNLSACEVLSNSQPTQTVTRVIVVPSPGKNTALNTLKKSKLRHMYCKVASLPFFKESFKNKQLSHEILHQIMICVYLCVPNFAEYNTHFFPRKGLYMI